MRSAAPAYSFVSSRNDSARILPASAGFFFAFRLFFVLLAVRLFGQDPQVGVGASLVVNYLLLCAVLFGSFGSGSAPRTCTSMYRVPCLRHVGLFFLMTGASLVWTVSPSLPAAIAFWLAMAADALIVLLLIRIGPVHEVVDSLMKGFVWGTCAIAVAAWLLPSQSDLRLGDEELLGPNQIGYACAFAVFFAQYLMRRTQGNWTIHTVLLTLTLLRSLSKTTIIAFVAAQGFILLRDRSIGTKTKWMLSLSALVVLLLFSGLLLNYYDVYTNAGNQSETLTGRIGIWAYFINEALNKPWIGHGFHSVWKVIPPFGTDQFEARHAHNELLQQFYAYGLMGVAVLITLYSSVFHEIRKLQESPIKVLFSALLLFVVIRGFADTEPFDLSLPMWTIVLIGFVLQQSHHPNEVLS